MDPTQGSSLLALALALAVSPSLPLARRRRARRRRRGEAAEDGLHLVQSAHQGGQAVRRAKVPGGSRRALRKARGAADPSGGCSQAAYGARGQHHRAAGRALRDERAEGHATARLARVRRRDLEAPLLLQRTHQGDHLVQAYRRARAAAVSHENREQRLYEHRVCPRYSFCRDDRIPVRTPFIAWTPWRGEQTITHWSDWGAARRSCSAAPVAVNLT